MSKHHTANKRHEGFFQKMQPWRREEGFPYEIQCVLGGGAYGEVLAARATSGHALSTHSNKRALQLPHPHFMHLA